MEWISTYSQHEDFDQAWGEVRSELQVSLSRAPDLLIIFVSSVHSSAWGGVCAYAHAAFPGAVIFGGSGRGTLEARAEMEDGPSVSVLAGVLGASAGVEAVYLSEDSTTMRARLDEISWVDANGVVVLADPFSMDGELLMELLDEHAPEVVKVGGLLSGGTRLGDHALWTNEGVFDEGAVLLVVRGSLSIGGVVSQSAAPIGDPLIVLRKRGYLIDEFDRGRPADVLQTAVDQLEEPLERSFLDRVVLGLDVGDDEVVASEPQYLMRTVIGLDPDSGALAIAAVLKNYQLVQFHLRDAKAARALLAMDLAEARRARSHQSICGALMFSCYSRVSDETEPVSDAELVADAVDGRNVAGVFCGGEFGPVGARTYTQTFSTVVALLCETAYH